MQSITTRDFLGALAAICAMALSGCTGDASQPQTPTAATPVADASAGHEHGAWWCNEHGVPEEVCARCDPRVAAEFTKKGDWCQDHDRPDSQCFVCHPELEAKFAAQYEAKYGKQPPKPEE